jgi:hypothetical protein
MFIGFPVALFLEWHRESRSTWHALSHHDLCTDQHAEAMPLSHTSSWPRGFPCVGAECSARAECGRCQKLLAPVLVLGCGGILRTIPTRVTPALLCKTWFSPPGDCAHPAGSIQAVVIGRSRP